MKQIPLSFLVLFIFSCNQRQEMLLKSILLEEKFEIPFHGENYQAIPSFYDLNMEGELLIYDNVSDELQLVNIPEKSIVKRIKIQRDGPNAISSNIGHVFYFEDSYNLVTNDAIYLMDSGGVVYKKISFISILEKLKLDSNKKIKGLNGGWDKTTGEVYLQYELRNSHDDQFKSLSKSMEIVRFDPYSESGELFELPTPDGLVKDGRGHYFTIDPKISISEGKIIYMWSVFPDVFVFDIHTKNTIKLTCIPENYSQIQPFPYSDYTKTSPYYYREDGTSFSRISYDSKNELVYRIYINYLNNQQKGGLKISVTSLSGQCLSSEIPENSGWALFTFEGKLFIIQKDIPNEDALRINRYSISEN